MVANAKKVIRMERVKRPVPTKLCESCMASYQELEILQIPMPKATEFLKKLDMDIAKLLPITFSHFQYFL